MSEREKASIALKALDEAIPPHLRTSRHGLGYLGERYEIIRRGLERQQPLRVADALHESLSDKVDTLLYELRRQVLKLPAPGTPAADLTEQEKFALAVAMGAPYKTEMGDDYKLHFTTAAPVGIADRGDGGWIVAIGRAHEDPW